MTKYEENKYSMYLTVKQVLTDNQAAVATIAMFKTVCDDFSALMKSIEEKDVEYKNIAKGKSQEIDNAEDLLIDRLTAVAGALYIYGRRTKSEQIKSTMRLKRNVLKKLRDTELLQTAKNVRGVVEEHKAALAVYGVNAAVITNFQNSINAYEAALSDGQTKSTQSVASRGELKALFAEADGVLKEDIDFFMESFKASHAHFYAVYKNARIIKDL